MSLSAQIKHYRNVVIVSLQGELDHHSAEQIRNQLDEALQKQQVHHMLMNLEHLKFMDSSGIGVILGRYKLVKSKGGRLMLCSVSSPVQRLLELSGLFKIVDVYENESLALSSLEVVS